MKIAYINREDVLNGPGIRVSLWTQGCSFNCPECHNKHLQDFCGGYELGEEDLDSIISTISEAHVSGLSILGGEPLMQDSKELYKLCKTVSEKTGKNIWLWTGYSFENIPKEFRLALDYIDVVVDGLFIKDLYDPELLWRGSSNQRIIDVRKTLSEGQISTIDQSSFV